MFRSTLHKGTCLARSFLSIFPGLKKDASGLNCQRNGDQYGNLKVIRSRCPSPIAIKTKEYGFLLCDTLFSLWKFTRRYSSIFTRRDFPAPFYRFPTRWRVRINASDVNIHELMNIHEQYAREHSRGGHFWKELMNRLNRLCVFSEISG